MLGYLQDNDFAKVGQLTEENALRCMLRQSSFKPFSYLTEESYQAMDAVRKRSRASKRYFYHGRKAQCHPSA